MSYAFELPAWLQHLVAIWPVLAAVAVVIFAIAAAIFTFRIYEKTGIHKTNTANIHALEGLIETKEKEIDELNAECEDLKERNDYLESEYKTLAGLVIAELLTWAGNFERHKAELLQKESEIRILQTRLELMEKRESEFAAIHTSK